MKKTRLCSLWPFFATILLSVTLDARADYFGEPPSSSIESEWRNAGSVFLTGIAETLNGLAAIQGRDIPTAQSEMAKASASLGKAGALYSGIQSHLTAPRTINLSKLPPQRVGDLEGLLLRYERRPPTDERQAARLAGEEVQRLTQVLERDKELFARYTLENFQALVAEVTRALQLGTGLAELMKYGIVER